MADSAGKKLLANNKKATFEYFIEERYEAGIELFGTEVKSIRMGKVSIKEAYIDIKNGEAFICGMNVTPYEKGNIFNKDPLRVRRLLLHKQEIRFLDQASIRQGYTIVPLSVYLKDGRVKLEIALAKGKHLYDKRESAAKKDRQRETEKEFKLSFK